MINFSTLQGISIPEGVVTQIADENGAVLWSRVTEENAPIILEVEKITSDTYAGETLYEGEQFILLDIYPKTNGTVSVTYGGLTKTITDTSGASIPNAIQVFFGTFNGVSDEQVTAQEGTLTIEGDYRAYGVGTYKVGATIKTKSKYCSCITAVDEVGNIEYIPSNAYYECTKLSEITIPKTMHGILAGIGGLAFYGCTGLQKVVFEKNQNRGMVIGADAFSLCTGLKDVYITDIAEWCRWFFITGSSNPLCYAENLYFNNEIVTEVTFPDNVTSVNAYCFYNYDKLAKATIPYSVTLINIGAFQGCTNLNITNLPNEITTIGNSAFYDCSNLNLTSLPNSLIDIGDEAFANCTKISIGEIPSGVKSIGSFAFEMPRLFEDLSTNMPNEIILPSTIETIGDRPFYYYDRNGKYSSYIATYYVYATTPPVLEGQYGLAETGIANIYVPKGCVDLYKSAEGWSKHAYEIKEMP